ncbi:uncharacterized protein LOC108675500 [Hyalella azteca]|uniref:Uncharacterized protein LOC108675500 n=1 Tax=Hyalella azteca TaxID=294128 RepID=A0A8B7NYW7_HYAAZ|nr:uncharacterized protein LOC108675500 [Hyalella azteca]
MNTMLLLKFFICFTVGVMARNITFPSYDQKMAVRNLIRDDDFTNGDEQSWINTIQDSVVNPEDNLHFVNNESIFLPDLITASGKEFPSDEELSGGSGLSLGAEVLENVVFTEILKIFSTENNTNIREVNNGNLAFQSLISENNVNIPKSLAGVEDRFDNRREKTRRNDGEISSSENLEKFGEINSNKIPPEIPESILTGDTGSGNSLVNIAKYTADIQNKSLPDVTPKETTTENIKTNQQSVKEGEGSTPTSKPSGRVRREVQGVTDLESVYGNRFPLNQQQLSDLIPLVVEDMRNCDLDELFSDFILLKHDEKRKRRETDDDTSRLKVTTSFDGTTSNDVNNPNINFSRDKDDDIYKNMHDVNSIKIEGIIRKEGNATYINHKNYESEVHRKDPIQEATAFAIHKNRSDPEPNQNSWHANATVSVPADTKYLVSTIDDVQKEEMNSEIFETNNWKTNPRYLSEYEATLRNTVEVNSNANETNFLREQNNYKINNLHIHSEAPENNSRNSREGINEVTSHTEEKQENKEEKFRRDDERILRRRKRFLFSLFREQERQILKVPELIRSQGYPSEVHTVITEDGYILELHRIPGARFRKERRKKFFKRDVEENPIENFHEVLQDYLPRSEEYLRASEEISEEDGTPLTPLIRPSQILEEFGQILANNPQDSITNLKSTAPRSPITDNTNKYTLENIIEAIQHLFDSTDINDPSPNLNVNGSNPSNEPPGLKRLKRSRIYNDFFPVFLSPDVDSSPQFVTAKLKRKKMRRSAMRNYGFDMIRNPWDHNMPRRRPPVLIHHGLFASSANFVLSDAHRGALAYLLADAGYDVWLGNWRGNSYSKGHVRLDPDSNEFWDFSLDEIMRYDIPAVVNYILATSGERQLRYVGHSLGCAMFFGATNLDSTLAHKVRVMAAMAPAAFMDNSFGVLRNTILSVKNYYFILDRLDLPDLSIPVPVRVRLARHFCGTTSVMRVPCLFLVDAFMGKVKKPEMEYYTSVLLSHFPSTLASTRILAHFGQFVNSDGMRMYNFGPAENMRRYGQPDPPRYDLSTVTSPVAVIWGPGDTVITPEDVALCVERLPNVILNYRVPREDFNHLDFIFPEQAAGLVYRPILQLLSWYR